MAQRIYADYPPCEHCEHQPESLFLISVSGYRRFSWSNKTMKSLEYLKEWLREKHYILAGVTKFTDNYEDEIQPEEILETIERAETIIELDFIPV